MTKGSANRIARFRLVARIERLLEVPGTYLAVVFAVGLAVELVLIAQGAAVPEVLGWLLLAIWGFFLVQFVLGIVVSPDRLLYLRRMLIRSEPTAIVLSSA